LAQTAVNNSNFLKTKIDFSPLVGKKIIVVNVSSLAPVAVFDTDENKYTENFERKKVIERKKIFTSAF
jgi:ribosomal protein L13